MGIDKILYLAALTEENNKEKDYVTAASVHTTQGANVNSKQMGADTFSQKQL